MNHTETLPMRPCFLCASHAADCGHRELELLVLYRKLRRELQEPPRMPVAMEQAQVKGVA